MQRPSLRPSYAVSPSFRSAPLSLLPSLSLPLSKGETEEGGRREGSLPLPSSASPFVPPYVDAKILNSLDYLISLVDVRRRRRRRIHVDVDVEDILAQAKRLFVSLTIYSDNAIKYTIILIKLYHDFQFLEFALGNHK